MVRLVVGAARFPGMGLLRCSGPNGGPRVPALLPAPVWLVRVQSNAKSAGKDFRDGEVITWARASNPAHWTFVMVLLC